MGGPCGASQKRATTEVVVHFPSSLSATDNPSAKFQHGEPRQDPKAPTQRQTTTRLVFESPVRSGYFAHLALTETETG